jgi:hypothetical protein
MPANKRTKFQVEADRRRVASMYLKGRTQAEIARELELSQQQISYDLKIIQQQWREQTALDLDEEKGKVLAKINQLERDYWLAWEESCEDKQVKESQSTQGGNLRQGQTRATLKRESATGNPAFLAGVQWCIERRCKLLGLDAPEKREHTVREFRVVFEDEDAAN